MCFKASNPLISTGCLTQQQKIRPKSSCRISYSYASSWRWWARFNIAARHVGFIENQRFDFRLRRPKRWDRGTSCTMIYPCTKTSYRVFYAQTRFSVVHMGARLLFVVLSSCFVQGVVCCDEVLFLSLQFLRFSAAPVLAQRLSRLPKAAALRLEGSAID
jgi:hypothetical protein